MYFYVFCAAVNQAKFLVCENMHTNKSYSETLSYILNRMNDFHFNHPDKINNFALFCTNNVKPELTLAPLMMLTVRYCL